MKVFTSVEVISSSPSLFLSFSCKLPLYSFNGLSPHVQNISRRHQILQFGHSLVRKDVCYQITVDFTFEMRALEPYCSGAYIVRLWNISYLHNGHTFRKNWKNWRHILWKKKYLTFHSFSEILLAIQCYLSEWLHLWVRIKC